MSAPGEVSAEGNDNPSPEPTDDTLAPKVVSLEELETSIERIIERSLQKATQRQGIE